MTDTTISDQITLEVLASSFRAICDEASAFLARVAYAPTITEGHDVSQSLLTARGELVAHGRRDQAAHLGTFEESVRTVIQEMVGFREGDVVIFNDPYTGGTHQPDVKLIRPVFVEGRLLAYAISCGHWPDVGGPVPASFNPRATECYAEGLRIPPTLVVDQGRRVRSTFELIKANMRLADERLADLEAQIRATEIMERRLLEYTDRYGADLVERAMYSKMDHSERLFREAVGQLPQGVYEFEDFGDCDVMHPDQPRIRVHMSMTIDGDDVTFDLSDSDGEPIGPWGFARAALLGAIYDGTMHCFPDLVPLNHGITRALTVIAPPGLCVNVRPPKPVLLYVSGAYEKVSAMTMACWAQAFADSKPNRMHAATVNLANLTIAGVHPHSGRQYLAYLYNEGGQGARSYKDGNSLQPELFAGGAQNQPVELMERLYPIRYLKCEARPESAGAGQFRGGLGVDRSFEVTGPMQMTMHGDRELVTPFGLAGGLNGGPNQLILNPGTEEEQSLGMHALAVPVQPGDRLYYVSNGGGGFGDPYSRDPAAVAADAAEELISPELAAEVYGVVLAATDNGFEVDEEATQSRRSEGRIWETGYGPQQVHPVGAKVLPRVKVQPRA